MVELSETEQKEKGTSMRERPSTMVARSPFYERKAKEQRETKLQKKRREICLACTKEDCSGTCELMAMEKK